MRHLLLVLFFIALQVPRFSIGQTNLTSAVNFTVVDLNGDTLRLFDLLDSGKFVLVEFSTTSCFPCQGNAPLLNQAYHDFGCNASDLFVLGVNLDGTNASVLSYCLNYDIDFPYVSGLEGGANGVFTTYGNPLSPTVILIAPDHTIPEQDVFPVSEVVPLLESYGLVQNSCDQVLLADFSMTPQTIQTGGSVDFSDLSSGNPTGWTWSISGGNPAASTDQNPLGVQFAANGNFPVRLQVSHGLETASRTRIVHVVPPGSPQVNFEANVTEITQGQSVFFTDLSTGNPTSWNWTFVGGTPIHATVQNPPSVLYSNPGFYSVFLTATNSNGTGYLTRHQYIHVLPSEPPVQFCDTISNLLPFDSLMVMPVQGGWLPGNNGLNITEYADFFANTSYDRLTGLMVPVGISETNFLDSKIRFKVWDGDVVPGTVLGSKDVPLIGLTTNFYYLIVFDNPLPLSGNFFVGYQLSNVPGDQFAASMANDRGNLEPATMFVNMNSSWIPLADVGVLGGVHSSMGILPVVCNSTGIEPHEGIGLTRTLVFPNPSSGVFQVESAFDGGVQFEVWDMVGRPILKDVTRNSRFQIDLQDQPAGVYFLKLKHSGGSETLKLVRSVGGR